MHEPGRLARGHLVLMHVLERASLMLRTLW